MTASVLGTSTLSSQFLQQLKEDLSAEEMKKQSGFGTFGETMRSCISKGELEHMESPAADEAHLKKLDKMVDNWFTKIPLPKDPMRAALAPTKEELAEQEKFEVLKEAMRERYQSANRRKRAEEERIGVAMKRVEDGTHPAYNKASKYEAFETVSEKISLAKAADNEADALRKELEEMKRKVAALEASLKQSTSTSV
eukprot:TRINITY_DN31382_c0_g1_i1.p1 TRINITY_DN31382_c0_g1~~TRINITY_DN31382_c0_g1_i1.p1  ORF type:complete len:226 (-),score=32.14 TRINITY_DN31382_c0_g1_i1:2-592(-)